MTDNESGLCLPGSPADGLSPFQAQTVLQKREQERRAKQAADRDAGDLLEPIGEKWRQFTSTAGGVLQSTIKIQLLLLVIVLMMLGLEAMGVL